MNFGWNVVYAIAKRKKNYSIYSKQYRIQWLSGLDLKVSTLADCTSFSKLSQSLTIRWEKLLRQFVAITSSWLIVGKGEKLVKGISF